MGKAACVAWKGIEDREVALTEAHGVPSRRVAFLDHCRETVAQEGLDVIALAGLGDETDEQCRRDWRPLAVKHWT